MVEINTFRETRMTDNFFQVLLQIVGGDKLIIPFC